MARLMDSLILNDFPPYTFTKITTTHRPTRTANGIAATKLLNKSTANIPQTLIGGLVNNGPMNGSLNNLNGNGNILNNGLRTPMQRSKVPTQGKTCFCIKMKTKKSWDAKKKQTQKMTKDAFSLQN